MGNTAAKEAHKRLRASVLELNAAEQAAFGRLLGALERTCSGGRHASEAGSDNGCLSKQCFLGAFPDDGCVEERALLWDALVHLSHRNNSGSKRRFSFVKDRDTAVQEENAVPVVHLALAVLAWFKGLRFEQELLYLHLLHQKSSVAEAVHYWLLVAVNLYGKMDSTAGGTAGSTTGSTTGSDKIGTRHDGNDSRRGSDAWNRDHYTLPHCLPFSETSLRALVDLALVDYTRAEDPRSLLALGSLVSSALSASVFALLVLPFVETDLSDPATDRAGLHAQSTIGARYLRQRLIQPPRDPHSSLANSELLTLPMLWFLHHLTPLDLRSEPFQLVYSTKAHGHSWSAFLAKLLESGSFLLLVQDSKGHVFGGFVDTQLQLRPSFQGSEGSFVFTLHPQMRMYKPTGFNSNFVYLNAHTSTLPNGLGLGGQLEYFGLWLSAADFRSGHSKAHPLCSTFGSPCLASSELFAVENVELICLGERHVRTGQQSDERRQQTLAFLEIAGKRPSAPTPVD